MYEFFEGVSGMNGRSTVVLTVGMDGISFHDLGIIIYRVKPWENSAAHTSEHNAVFPDPLGPRSKKSLEAFAGELR